MTIEPLPFALDADTAVERVDVDEIEFGSPKFAFSSQAGYPEVHVNAERVARFVAGLFGLFLAIGIARWAFVATRLFQPPPLACVGCGYAEWFRWTELGLAVAGIGAGLVAVLYLANFAIAGQARRRWRGVIVTFGIITAAWVLLYWLDYFFKIGRANGG